MGTGFSPSTSVFPCQFHSTGAPLHVKNKNKIKLIIFHLHYGCTRSLKAAVPFKKKRKKETWFLSKCKGSPNCLSCPDEVLCSWTQTKQIAFWAIQLCLCLSPAYEDKRGHVSSRATARVTSSLSEDVVLLAVCFGPACCVFRSPKRYHRFMLRSYFLFFPVRSTWLAITPTEKQIKMCWILRLYFLHSLLSFISLHLLYDYRCLIYLRLSFCHFSLSFPQLPTKCHAVWQTSAHNTTQISRTYPKHLLVVTLTEGINGENGIPCFENVATSGVRRRGLCPSGSTASETFTLFLFLCGSPRASAVSWFYNCSFF